MCMHVYVDMQTAYTRACVLVYVVCMHVCMKLCTCTCNVCVYVCVCVRVYGVHHQWQSCLVAHIAIATM